MMTFTSFFPILPSQDPLKAILYIIERRKQHTNYIKNESPKSVNANQGFIDQATFLKAIQIDQSGTHTGVYGQITPTPDGSITTFNLFAAAQTGTLEVYKNGKELIQGTDEDWVEAGGNQFTLNFAPLATDILTGAYVTEASAGSLTESQAGGTGDSYYKFNETPNGGRTTFTTTAGAFVASTMRLYKNGQLQIEGATNDFTMDGDASSVTFNTAPLTGNILAGSAQKKQGRQIDQSGGTSDTYGAITGAIPGTTYVASRAFEPSTLILSKNGKRLTQGSAATDDYYINGSQGFILNHATLADDELTASYEPYVQPQLSAVKIGTTAVTTTYTVTGSDYFVTCDATTAAFTVTLPDAGTRRYQLPVTIKKTDSSANAVTVATTGSDTIDNEATQELSNEGEAIIIMSDGSNYHIG